MTSEIDWASLSHAYGDAADTPVLLEKLRDEDEWEEALGDLNASILHQGTIYTATLPAIPELVRIVQDETAPSRVGAAWLIAEYADSVRAGAAANPYYLPKGTDMASFEASAHRVLNDAVAGLTSCLDDSDPQIRQIAAIVMQRADDLPPATMDALHARLAVENAPIVTTAVLGAINAHGELTTTEIERLDSDDLRFADATSALLAGKATSIHVATAVRLWNAQVTEFEETQMTESAIDDIMAASGVGAKELVDALALESGRALQDAIVGYCLMADGSRSALMPAVEGLLGIAERIPVVPGADDPLPGPQGHCLRNITVYGLVHVAAGVDHTMRARFCEDVWELATTSPRPTWESRMAESPVESPVNDARWRDIRADGVRVLLAMGDPRWLDLFTMAVDAAHGRTIFCGTFTMWSNLINTVGQMLKTYPCPPDQIPALVDLIKRELPSDNNEWFTVLAALPSSSTENLAATVVALLDQSSAGTVTYPDGSTHENPLLGLCAPFLAAWKASAAVPKLTELANAKWDQAPWAEAALNVITGESRIDRSVDRHGLPRYSEDSFLRLWAMAPTPGLAKAACSLVGKKPSTSYPGRHDQLLAARIAADQGRLEASWPVVEKIIEKGDEPMASAVTTAINLTTDDPERREELAALLQTIAESKPQKLYRGPDFAAPVIAWDGLDRLGHPLHPKAAKNALTLITAATHTDNYWLLDAVPLACDLLVRVARTHPKKVPTITDALTALIGTDSRIAVYNDIIEQDTEFTTVVRQTLDAIR